MRPAREHCRPPSMGRRSRKRASTPVAPPSRASPGRARADAGCAARRDPQSRREDAPQPPWAPFPLTELVHPARDRPDRHRLLLAGGERRGVLLGGGFVLVVARRPASCRCASTSPATARTRRCWPAPARSSPRCRCLAGADPPQIVAARGRRRRLRRCGLLGFRRAVPCVATRRRSGSARDRRRVPARACARAAERRMRCAGLHHVTADLRRPRPHDRLLPRRARPRARRARPTTTTTRTRATSGSATRPARRARSCRSWSTRRWSRAQVGAARSTTSPSASARPRSRSPGATTCARAGCDCTEVLRARRRLRSIYLRDPDGNIARDRARPRADRRVAGAGRPATRRSASGRSATPGAALARSARSSAATARSSSWRARDAGARSSIRRSCSRTSGSHCRNLRQRVLSPAPLAREQVGDRHARRPPTGARG